MRVYEKLPKPLTDDELLRYGQELAAEVKRLGAIEQERKTAMAQLRAAGEATREKVVELTMLISSGYSKTEVEVLALMDTPVPGTKRIIRVDTNETVREEPMTDAERQDNFGFMREV